MKGFAKCFLAIGTLAVACSTTTNLMAGQCCSRCLGLTEKIADALIPIGLQIAGVFVTNEQARDVLDKIQKVYTIARPALAVLAKICNDQPAQLTAEQIETLQANGLIKADGTIDPMVKQLIKEAVILNPPGTTRSLAEDEIQSPLSFEDYAAWCGTLGRVHYARAAR